MDDLKQLFKNRSTLTNLVIVLLLLVGLPIGLGLVRQQQILRSRADDEPIVFVAGDCVKDREDGSQYAICGDLDLQLTSMLGPGDASSSATPSASLSPAPSSSTSASATPTTPTTSASPGSSSSPSGAITFIDQPASFDVTDNTFKIKYTTNVCPVKSTIFYRKKNTSNYSTKVAISPACSSGKVTTSLDTLNTNTAYEVYIEAEDASSNKAKSSTKTFNTSCNNCE